MRPVSVIGLGLKNDLRDADFEEYFLMVFFAGPSYPGQVSDELYNYHDVACRYDWF